MFRLGILTIYSEKCVGSHWLKTQIFTDRARTTRKVNVYTWECLSTPGGGGGWVPPSFLTGGGTPSRLMGRGYPHPDWLWGYPREVNGVPPGWDWMGVPPPPPAGTGWRYPLPPAGTGWGNLPPPPPPPPRTVWLGQVMPLSVRLLRFPAGGLSCSVNF